jgi:hypothetical protein
MEVSLFPAALSATRLGYDPPTLCRLMPGRRRRRDKLRSLEFCCPSPSFPECSLSLQGPAWLSIKLSKYTIPYVSALCIADEKRMAQCALAPHWFLDAVCMKVYHFMAVLCCQNNYIYQIKSVILAVTIRWY